jgi:hypothetical protein
MGKGYAGRILLVDLTSGSIEEHTLPEGSNFLKDVREPRDTHGMGKPGKRSGASAEINVTRTGLT